MSKKKYTAADIQVLTGTEAVRRRPGMYIGDVHDGSGLHHLIWEVVANALDQHLAGNGSEIRLDLNDDGSCTVDDDGCGLPVEWRDGRALEIVMTVLHAGATWDGHAPHEHIGGWGVGLAPLNAVCEWTRVEVFRLGSHYFQEFSRGEKRSEFQRLGPATRTGTRVTFLPDKQIFSRIRFDSGVIERKFTELALPLPKLRFVIRDHRITIIERPTGFLSLLDGVPLVGGSPFQVDQVRGDVRIEVVAAWHPKETDSQVESYANIVRTTGGGTHVDGLLRGLSRGLRKALGAGGGAARLRREALRRGLRGCVCVRLTDAEYGDPTRDRLDTPRVSALVSKCVAEAFAEYLRGEAELLAHLACT